MVASRIPSVGIVPTSTFAENILDTQNDDGFEYNPNRCSWQVGGSSFIA